MLTRPQGTRQSKAKDLGFKNFGLKAKTDAKA